MKRTVRRVLLAAWLGAAVVTWNGVFDAHVTAGARRYLDQEEAFVQQRGPRADMDLVMRTAVARGVRAATLWALAVLAPGVAVLAARRRARS